MFSTSIDFRGDLKRGDRFNVVYETFWLDGEMVRPAASWQANSSTAASLPVGLVRRPVTKQGGYYSLDGKALKKPS
jgi:hypothetical protein